MARYGITRSAAVRSRDQWDAKLRALGHQLQWFCRVVPSYPERWRGICLRCESDIECGSGPAARSLRRDRGRCGR
jgi:hypothetical protein